MNAFDAAISAAAGANPMTPTGPVPGRILYADGDGLAYYCAGNDDTDPGRAKQNLVDKIASARVACGASEVRLLVTEQGSHKGHRYAVATVKPYQGQRSNARRPKNWVHLRELVTRGWAGVEAVGTSVAEADDLFAYYSHKGGPQHAVIYTQDKDMRMVPGWHLDWQTHRMFYLPPAVYSAVWNDKQYGAKWFWLQMLHGDTADNIPGLPKYVPDKGKPKLCGEKTAAALLEYTSSTEDAAKLVLDLYCGYYGDVDGPVHLLEQACLLWMRRKPEDALDCVLHVLWPVAPKMIDAVGEIRRRIEGVPCAS